MCLLVLIVIGLIINIFRKRRVFIHFTKFMKIVCFMLSEDSKGTMTLFVLLIAIKMIVKCFVSILFLWDYWRCKELNVLWIFNDYVNNYSIFRRNYFTLVCPVQESKRPLKNLVFVPAVAAKLKLKIFN